MSSLPKLLTPQETAAALGIRVDTLAVWRCTQRYNLPHIKVGRLIKYRENDIQAFIDSRTIGATRGSV